MEKKEQDIRGEAKTGNPVPDQRIWTSRRRGQCRKGIRTGKEGDADGLSE